MAQLTEMVPPSVAGGLLRAVFGLPAPVRRLLAGSPVRRDGQLLSLDAQLLLRMMKLEDASLTAPTVEQARPGSSGGRRTCRRRRRGRSPRASWTRRACRRGSTRRRR
ncbi:hypothetical protein LUW74_23160 [Actinomadura madurae]|uniref:hypothetical protein n=1 Tax=Actinomadura madurae TaxID=1993 RepID=UPI002026CAB1|nr:hypothetical protein [Actinomadura madurae]URN05917.1 hypothetical protein LUW74_23160 [Actinomadura madurae]